MNVPLIRKIIRLEQPFERNVMVPVAIAQERLLEAFQAEIILDKQYFNTRHHYFGNLEQNQLIVRGPKAYRKFCFVVEGCVKKHGEFDHQTQIEARMRLCQEHERQLTFLWLCLFPCCIVIFQWFAIFYLPFFCLFLRWGVGVHFERYSTEIMELLASIMTRPLGGYSGK